MLIWAQKCTWGIIHSSTCLVTPVRIHLFLNKIRILCTSVFPVYYIPDFYAGNWAGIKEKEKQF